MIPPMANCPYSPDLPSIVANHSGQVALPASWPPHDVFKGEPLWQIHQKRETASWCITTYARNDRRLMHLPWVVLCNDSKDQHSDVPMCASCLNDNACIDQVTKPPGSESSIPLPDSGLSPPPCLPALPSVDILGMAPELKCPETSQWMSQVASADQ